MRLLLDTHILIWLATEPGELNAGEKQAILDPDATLLLSVVSLWEMRIKWEIRDRNGNRKGSVDPIEALAFAERNKIEVAPLLADAVLARLAVPVAHADPFDRMLLIHAQRLEAKLLTRDAKLLGHPLALAP